MGIFSDRCESCGARVKKRARVCSQCGTPAPGGWWKCPACDEWVGNDSKFCWNCKTPLHPEDRADMAGGVWQHPASLLAQRFEVGDMYILLKKGLSVQQGTLALLLDGGAVKDVLKAGRHNLDSLGHRINHWGDPPPRSAVLINAGDTVLPLRVGSLRSAEEMEVEFYGEAVLRFVPGDAALFMNNLMKDQRELTFADLAERLQGDIRYALENMCNSSTIEDLVKDPQRRLRLEDELSVVLKRTLKSIGFVLAALSGAEFSGKAYELLRQQAEDVEVKRREAEFNARLRDVLRADRMHAMKDEDDFAAYAAQLAQERDISAMHRDQEVALLKEQFRQELAAKSSDFVRTEATRDTEFKLDLARREDAYRWEKQRGDAAVKLEIEDAEVSKTLEWREKKERLSREHEEGMRRIEREDDTARAKAFQGLDPIALIAAIGDGERGRRLLELLRDRRFEGKTAEEILAMQTEASPAVADALRRLEEARQIRAENDVARQKQIMDEAAERLERVLREAMNTTSDAAKRPGGDTHIIR
ncbi:MAG TPA: zinc ribbon domain-containing protein [Lentisphaeria bacterium]|nr:hypothetical protein [Lentisphaerota bacterium]OQC16914.1 MAG: Double zinc ribbon [Lentisphaerae bacterium ADurb.Bin082]HPY89988.1 zinc ribbon domain-containing protein [Lentisphaeria bacterium]HQL87284.1 zinc ribbon domain-containing protein [Lentisphaeria bacterium]